MLFIPGIIFGGKAAAAIGALGSVGGMVQNKGVEGAIDTVAKERARQVANADDRMRSELAKAGIHVGANSDVGSVYSQYMAGLDRQAGDMASAAMYGNYSERYGGVQAQSIQSQAQMIGAGATARNMEFDTIKSSGIATGATSFASSVAQGQGLINAGAVSEGGAVNPDYFKGQIASAHLQASQVIGTGKEAAKTSSEDLSAVGESKGSKALGIDVKTMKADKEAGVIGGDNMMTDLAKDGAFANALKTAGAMTGAGKELARQSAKDLVSAAEAEASDAMNTSVQKMKTGKEKGLIGSDNMVSDAGRMATSLEAGVAADQRIGNFAAITMNKAVDPDIYMANAMMAGMTQAQSAFKAMNTKGGMMAALDTDIAAASLGAAEMQSALKGKLKAFGAKGATLEEQADSQIKKISSVAERQSYVQSASTLQDMSMKDKHGGFEKIALKSAAIQTAGQIADVKGFENNFGTSMSGVESFLNDTFQQSRKKYASVHGSARAISGWSNSALAQNAEFSEQSQIESAQAQIREGGGSAKGAAHRLARKAAADMRGLVRTQDKLDSMGGYEETSAYMAEQAAVKTLGALMGDLNTGQAEVKPVYNKKGKVVGGKIVATEQAVKAAELSGMEAAAGSMLRANAAFDSSSRAAIANNMLERLGGDKAAAGRLAESGILMAVKDSEGNIVRDKDGDAMVVRNQNGSYKLENAYNAAHAGAINKATHEVGGGIKGMTLADGTKVALNVGANADGKIVGSRSAFDSSQINSNGEGTNLNAPQAFQESLADVVGPDAARTVLATLTALGLGATAANYTKMSTPVRGKDGSYTTKDGKAVAKEKGKYYEMGENGSYALDENGKPIEVDKDDLKTKEQSVLKTGWEGTRRGVNKIGDKLGLSSKSPADNKVRDASDSSTHNSKNEQGSKSNSPKDNGFTDHSTPPNSTSSSSSDTNNFNTDGNGKQGLSHAKAAGLAGTTAFVADALATGNMGAVGNSLKEFGQKIMDGNIFGKGGAIADVEGLIVGKASLDTARSQIDKGQIASGFATLAKGMMEQAVNGVAEIGEMAVAFGNASIGNGSYAQNRKNDYIPSLNINGPHASGEAPAVAQQQAYAQRQEYAQATAQTGTYAQIQAAANDNAVSAVMAATQQQRASVDAFLAGSAGNAIDIQQTHSMRQQSERQVEYIQSVSHSMNEMVGSLAEMNGFLEKFFTKAEGKVSDKA